MDVHTNPLILPGRVGDQNGATVTLPMLFTARMVADGKTLYSEVLTDVIRDNLDGADDRDAQLVTFSIQMKMPKLLMRLYDKFNLPDRVELERGFAEEPVLNQVLGVYGYLTWFRENNCMGNDVKACLKPFLIEKLVMLKTTRAQRVSAAAGGRQDILWRGSLVIDDGLRRTEVSTRYVHPLAGPLPNIGIGPRAVPIPHHSPVLAHIPTVPSGSEVYYGGPQSQFELASAHQVRTTMNGAPGTSVAHANTFGHPPISDVPFFYGSQGFNTGEASSNQLAPVSVSSNAASSSAFNPFPQLLGQTFWTGGVSYGFGELGSSNARILSKSSSYGGGHQESNNQDDNDTRIGHISPGASYVMGLEGHGSMADVVRYGAMTNDGPSSGPHASDGGYHPEEEVIQVTDPSSTAMMLSGTSPESPANVKDKGKRPHSEGTEEKDNRKKMKLTASGSE